MRDVPVWSPAIAHETRSDGSMLVWQKDPLPDYPRCLSDRILHWAEHVPERTWMAERSTDGAWLKVSYGRLAELMDRIGGAFLELGLSTERPLMILAENSLEHAILALSAQHVGVPSAAVAPAYALAGGSYGKLREVVRQITPGAVFVKDAAPFAPAIAEVFPADLPVLSVSGEVAGRPRIGWDALAATAPSSLARSAFERLGPDTVAKFLFTSGTTGSPKAVIQTQRMLCANMEQVRDCFAFMVDEPPVLVDWAPWNHVASGSKVFNMALYNGGTFYIDAGKPTPEGMGQTIRNLREVSPSWYFNLPLGFDMLCEAMETDAALAESFFRRLRMIMYAGAGLSKPTWNKLEALSLRTTGARTLLASGLGATETAPFCTFCTDPQEGPGNIGIPAKGVMLKLVPTGGKLEVRFKGPNVTPGYWRDEVRTREAFDEEGFYRMGDALRPADPADPSKGFFFDGRTAENFKLSTGTWVAVGALRAALIDAMGGLIRDAVIAGENRPELAALLIPFRPALERLVPAGAELDDAALCARPEVSEALRMCLAVFAAAGTGSSTRISRAMVLTEPLSFEKGEVTDKGSINQRAVRNNKAALIDALYDGATGTLLATSSKEDI